MERLPGVRAGGTGRRTSCGVTSRETVDELWWRLGSPARAIALVAHPDDESFGLGGLLAALVDAGASVGVVCCTKGEASTLGVTTDLGALRDGELRAAASALGLDEVTLFDHADGRLADVDPDVLLAEVTEVVGDVDLVVAFEPGGVTGHPDHRAATAVARRLAAGRGLPLVEWGVSSEVAAALRAELGAPFVAVEAGDGELVEVEVDRGRQLAAISCHVSQATDNPVLERRLELQGPCEHLAVHLGPATPMALQVEETGGRSGDGHPVV